MFKTQLDCLVEIEFVKFMEEKYKIKIQYDAN